MSRRRPDHHPCAWKLEGRPDETAKFLDLGTYETQSMADTRATAYLAYARSIDFEDAEVRITPIGRDDMSCDWTGPEYTLSLEWHQSGGDLYLHFADGETVHKHYEWWQKQEAQDDAFLLAKALKLTASQAA